MPEAGKNPSPAQTPTQGHGGPDQFSAAIGDYVKALQGIQEDLQRRQTETYFKYLRTCMEAWGQPDASKRIEAAYFSYLNESLELHSPTRVGETTKRTAEACRSCLAKVQETLSSVNLSTLSPQALAQFGQSLIAAAYFTSWIPRA